MDAMETTAWSFERRLQERDGPGTVISSGPRDDELAAAAGWVFSGVARNNRGEEVHVFTRPDFASTAHSNTVTLGSKAVEKSVETAAGKPTIEDDILRLREAIRENRGWNDGMRLLSFCDPISRVLDKLEAARAALV